MRLFLSLNHTDSSAATLLKPQICSKEALFWTPTPTKGTLRQWTACGECETVPYCRDPTRQKGARGSLTQWRQQTWATPDFPGQEELGYSAQHRSQMLLTLPACKRASQRADYQPAVDSGSLHVQQALCLVPLCTVLSLQSITGVSVRDKISAVNVSAACTKLLQTLRKQPFA